MGGGVGGRREAGRIVGGWGGGTGRVGGGGAERGGGRGKKGKEGGEVRGKRNEYEVLFGWQAGREGSQ